MWCGSGSKRLIAGALTGAPFEHEGPEHSRCRRSAGQVPLRSRIGRAFSASSTTNVNVAESPQRPEEQVAVDVDVGIGQRAGEARHPARPVVDLGQDRLALDVRVAALVEDGRGGLVVGGRHDHVAAVAHAPAADRPEVDAALGERLGQGRHRAGFVLQLDDELLGHACLRVRRSKAASRDDILAARTTRPCYRCRRFRHRPAGTVLELDRPAVAAVIGRRPRRRRDARSVDRRRRHPVLVAGLGRPDGPAARPRSTASRRRRGSGGGSGRRWRHPAGTSSRPTCRDTGRPATGPATTGSATTRRTSPRGSGRPVSICRSSRSSATAGAG